MNTRSYFCKSIHLDTGFLNLNIVKVTPIFKVLDQSIFSIVILALIMNADGPD